MGLVLEKDGSSLEPPRDNYTEIGQILTIAKANEIGQISLIVNLVEIGLFEIAKVAEIAVLISEVRLHFNNKTAMDIDALVRQHLPGRSRMSPSALLELPMFQQAQARLARMPSVLNGDKRIYRRLNEQQKRMIVYLRYASLEDFD